MGDGSQDSSGRRELRRLRTNFPTRKRQAAYRDLFKTALDPDVLREIRISTHGGYAIGSGRFREEIETALKGRATPRAPGRPRVQAEPRPGASHPMARNVR
jgi:hypothetical protein